MKALLDKQRELINEYEKLFFTLSDFNYQTWTDKIGQLKTKIEILEKQYEGKEYYESEFLLWFRKLDIKYQIDEDGIIYYILEYIYSTNIPSARYTLKGLYQYWQSIKH